MFSLSQPLGEGDSHLHPIIPPSHNTSTGLMSFSWLKATPSPSHKTSTSSMSFLRGGGIPFPGDGYLGVPLPRIGWGIPLVTIWWDPPPTHQDRMGKPPRQSSTASTFYAVGNMRLAFTQENSLVLQRCTLNSNEDNNHGLTFSVHIVTSWIHHWTSLKILSNCLQQIAYLLTPRTVSFLAIIATYNHSIRHLVCPLLIHC